MEKSLGSRFKNAFNAFFSRDPTPSYSIGPSYSYRPDRPRLSRGNEKSIITAVYNKIALDVSSINFHHCRVDDNGRYIEDIDSGLNECLNLEAN
ncbi:MAG: phage portal protein, partial [Candidatus Ornithospirochaeta sp.]